MQTQYSILDIEKWLDDLSQVWEAKKHLEIQIEKLKQEVRDNFPKLQRRHRFDQRMKIKILYSRIREFYRIEINHILKPCTSEIWEVLREPTTGKYPFHSLKVTTNKRRYTLYPVNRRVPKIRAKKITKAREYSLDFHRLYRQGRISKFASYFRYQMRRVRKGESV